MGAHRGRDGTGGGIDPVGTGQVGQTKGEGPGLVENHGAGLAQPLQSAAILDHDPLLEQTPCRGDLDHGHRESERAGAGDDENGDRDGERPVDVAGRAQPADEGQERGRVHHRCIEPRGPVGDAAIGRAAGLGNLHEADHLGKKGIRGGGGGRDGQRAGEVEGAGLKGRTGGYRLGGAFSRCEGAIDVGGSVRDACVDGNPFARRKQDRRARGDPIHRHIRMSAVGADDHGAARDKPYEPLHGRARPVAHHVVECPPRQQKEQERDRGVEIGVRPSVHGVVEAHAERQQDADRDRHVHVRPAMPQTCPGRAEEDPAGIRQRRKGDGRGKPMEQIARRGLGARPDGDREQHDVSGGEAGNGQRANQFGKRAVLVRRRRVVQVGRIAQADQGLDQGGRRVAGTPMHRGPLGGQVDPRMRHARQGGQRLLDPLHASAAVDRRHGQIDLAQSGSGRPAGQPQLLPRRLDGGRRDRL